LLVRPISLSQNEPKYRGISDIYYPNLKTANSGKLDRSFPATLKSKIASSSVQPHQPYAPALAFDHDDFNFELKMDGFRALTHVGPDETLLVSRKEN
jgi:ATP-dependent DNA ligase